LDLQGVTMHNIHSIWKARSMRFSGRLHKYWGKLTGDTQREFSGELAIMHGKLAEFHVRRGGAVRQRLHRANHTQQRRGLHVVA
jgi:uncharacterized protein YjbJ (UPF0337 family)